MHPLHSATLRGRLVAGRRAMSTGLRHVAKAMQSTLGELEPDSWVCVLSRHAWKSGSCLHVTIY